MTIKLVAVLFLLACLLSGCGCTGDQITPVSQEAEQTAAAEETLAQNKGTEDRKKLPEEETAGTGESDDILSIVRDLEEKKGIDISTLSDVRGLGEILHDAGYDVDARYLLQALREAGQEGMDSAGNGEVPDDGPHTHQYVGILDREKRIIRFTCEGCGDWYEEPMPWNEQNAENPEQLSAEVEMDSPLGNESRKYDGEAYFSMAIVPLLYQEWGENHYSWYFDADTAMVRVGVTVDGIDVILQGVKEGKREALSVWAELTGQVCGLSEHIQTIMNDAGFRATRVQVSLMDSAGASLYTAEGGEVWYDYLDSYFEATGKDPSALENEDGLQTHQDQK
ncbi:MAG: hypothetical protein IJ106_10950 [Parasporobacterium sp.]|nr:hypothetical protein [Parasporobacterium sp.]